MYKLITGKFGLIIFTLGVMRILCVLATRPPKQEEIRKYFYVFPINKRNPLELLCFPWGDQDFDDRKFAKKDVGNITWEGFVFSIISMCIFLFVLRYLIIHPYSDNTLLVLIPALSAYLGIGAKFVDIYVWFCRRREKRKK